MLLCVHCCVQVRHGIAPTLPLPHSHNLERHAMERKQYRLMSCESVQENNASMCSFLLWQVGSYERVSHQLWHVCYCPVISSSTALIGVQPKYKISNAYVFLFFKKKPYAYTSDILLNSNTVYRCIPPTPTNTTGGSKSQLQWLNFLLPNNFTVEYCILKILFHNLQYLVWEGNEVFCSLFSA